MMSPMQIINTSSSTTAYNNKRKSGISFVEKALGKSSLRGFHQSANNELRERDVNVKKKYFIKSEEETNGEDNSLEISIIGIKYLVDKRIPISRKLLWISSLMCCGCLVAYYVSSRVSYILSHPTQVAVTLRQNDSLQLPDITLCPNTPFNPDKLIERGMTEDGLPGSTFIQNGTFNASSLWESLAPSISFISGSSVNYVNTMPSWEQTFTTMGLCFRHRYDEDVKASGLSFGMSIRINWEKVYNSKALSDLEGLKVFFHEREDSALTEIDGINVTPGEDLSVAIRIKEFKSLHRKEHPCVENREYSRSRCVNHCFNHQLFLLTKCRLPFMMRGSDDLSESCAPAEIYKSAFQTFWKHAKRNLTLWAECGRSCMIECQKLIYTPYIESVAVANGLSLGKFTIYFPEMWYEIVEQKESYDLIAFLCDVGGTFGLFLGCSVLTLVELFELIISFIAQTHFSQRRNCCCFNNRKIPNDNPSSTHY